MNAILPMLLIVVSLVVETQLNVCMVVQVLSYLQSFMFALTLVLKMTGHLVNIVKHISSILYLIKILLQ